MSDLTVFYDGDCPLCSREISHYRTKAEAERIEWVDISAPNFSAVDWGLEERNLRARFHAKRPQGEVLQGVDAFIAIWEIVPGFGFLREMAKNRALRPLFDSGYWAFSKLRPYLPRRERCDSGACTIDEVRKES